MSFLNKWHPIIPHSFCFSPLFQELWSITAPRSGANSSSETSPPVRISSRISPKSSAACLWEESAGNRGSPRKYGESVQTAFRKRLQAQNPGSSCPEVTTRVFVRSECVDRTERWRCVCFMKPAFHWSSCAARWLFFCAPVSTLLMFLLMEACLCWASQHKAGDWEVVRGGGGGRGGCC